MQTHGAVIFALEENHFPGVVWWGLYQSLCDTRMTDWPIKPHFLAGTLFAAFLNVERGAQTPLRLGPKNYQAKLDQDSCAASHLRKYQSEAY